jgi:hypothetical protein
MQQETGERWHWLCVRAMSELDPKRLIDVLGELNALLTKDEKAIQEELKHDSRRFLNKRKTPQPSL